MSNILDDFKDHLVAKGVTTPITKSGMAEEPDDAIALYEYGRGPANKVVGLYPKGLQVRVRATSYATGRALLQTIEDELTKIGDEFNQSEYAGGIEINGNRYNKVRDLGGVNPMGRDEKDRIEMTQNFEVERTT